MDIAAREPKRRNKRTHFLPALLACAGILGAAGKACANANFEASLNPSAQAASVADKHKQNISFYSMIPKKDSNPNPTTGYEVRQNAGPNPAPQFGNPRALAPIAQIWPTPDKNGKAGGAPKPKPHQMKLFISGWSDANGMMEMYAGGRQRFKVQNSTGLASAAEAIDVDLHYNVGGWAKVFANDSDDEYDRAFSKIMYRIVNSKGEVIQQNSQDILNVTNTVESLDAGWKRIDELSDDSFRVTIPGHVDGGPSNVFTFDIEAYLYGQALSLKDPESELGKSWISDFENRMATEFPNPDMEVMVEHVEDGIMGDVSDYGAGEMKSVYGIAGSNPTAHHGLDTLFLSHAMISPDGPHDVAMMLEVPVEGTKQFAIENSLLAPGGRFGHDYKISIGTGEGEEFQESSDAEMLAILGTGSELPPDTLDDIDEPQPRDYWYSGADVDGPLVTSLSGNFELMPNEQTTGRFVVQLSDAADGVIDGLARFTLRQSLPGLAGDYDGNFIVDEGDFALWQKQFGLEGLQADGDASGHVGGGDYLLWQSHSGQLEVQQTAIAAVPEPASVALLLSCIVTLAWTRCGAGSEAHWPSNSTVSS